MPKQVVLWLAALSAPPRQGNHSAEQYKCVCHVGFLLSNVWRMVCERGLGKFQLGKTE